MEIQNIAESICAILGQGEDAALATVINQKGSAPRSSGSKMIVRSDGRIIGSVGGGLLEAEVIEAAPRIIKDKSAEIKVFNLSDKKGEGVDSICGGKIEVLLECIAANQKNIDFWQYLTTISGKKDVCLLAALPSPYSPYNTTRRCLVQRNNSVIGDNYLPENKLNKLVEKQNKSKKSSLLTMDNCSFWAETVSVPVTVYLFGAGHVALQTAILTNFTDFKTVVVDDREEFANAERFETADQIIVPKSFDSCFKDIPIDQNSYIVILTRGHRHDKTVLALALKTEAGYIGMIGSRNKVKTIYNDLLSQGFSQDDIKRVHSPIGLEIKAETPQEIAVSITAELIACRAE